MDEPLVISWQTWQTLQGGGGAGTQFKALARMRATEVLPTPRGPEKRKAWATRPCAMAFWQRLVMGSWPTTSSNVWGRHFRARTW